MTKPKIVSDTTSNIVKRLGINYAILYKITDIMGLKPKVKRSKAGREYKLWDYMAIRKWIKANKKDLEFLKLQDEIEPEQQEPIKYAP